MRDLLKPILAGINGVSGGAQDWHLVWRQICGIMSADARLVEGFTGIALVPDRGTYFCTHDELP